MNICNVWDSAFCWQRWKFFVFHRILLVEVKNFLSPLKRWKKIHHLKNFFHRIQSIERKSYTFYSNSPQILHLLEIFSGDISTWVWKKGKQNSGFFPFVHSISLSAPVTKHVSLQSTSLCKNNARVSGNNMHVLSQRGAQMEKPLKF